VTDSSKLRVEIALGRSIAALIPIMARLIRGGTFVPSVPTLVFEEEHRLVAMAPEEIVISRTDDLLDMWVMVRTSVELMRTAWEHRGKIGPEREPRQGIGAVELFKRLPGINCRQCRCDGCMEFATGLLTARTNITDCTPLQEPSSQCLQRSVRWLLGVTGLAVAR
jgi:ArsR family metal-binding transcriptional regulator